MSLRTIFGKLAMAGCLLAASSCGNPPSPAANDHSLAQEAKPNPIAKRPYFTIMEDVLVEDSVPQEAFDLIRMFESNTRKCMRNDDIFCKRADRVAEALEKLDICQERWNDPLDAEGLRIRKWHICGPTSFGIHSAKEYAQIIAAEARAAEGPAAVPCDDGGGNISMMEMCADKAFKEADADLNRTYQQVLRSLPAERGAKLRQSQREWLAGLEGAAAKGVVGWSPDGREYNFVYTLSLTDLTIDRTRWIRQTYLQK